MNINCRSNIKMDPRCNYCEKRIRGINNIEEEHKKSDIFVCKSSNCYSKLFCENCSSVNKGICVWCKESLISLDKLADHYCLYDKIYCDVQNCNSKLCCKLDPHYRYTWFRVYQNCKNSNSNEKYIVCNKHLKL